MPVISMLFADKTQKEYSVSEVSSLAFNLDKGWRTSSEIRFNDGKILVLDDEEFLYDGKETDVSNHYKFFDCLLYIGSLSGSSTTDTHIYDIPKLSDYQWKVSIREYEDTYDDEGCIGCGEEYSCGAGGYCAPCWEDRYGCVTSYDDAVYDRV